jgi:hypothetical protein
MGGPMIAVLRSKFGGGLARRLSESQKTLEVLEHVDQLLGISESPAVAAELTEQPEVSSEAAALPARHVVDKGAEQ